MEIMSVEVAPGWFKDLLGVHKLFYGTMLIRSIESMAECQIQGPRIDAKKRVFAEDFIQSQRINILSRNKISKNLDYV